jgi:hypothetical protein
MIVRKLSSAGIVALGLTAMTWAIIGTSASTVLAQQPDIGIGEVVHLERGKLIVVRTPLGETSYTLSPTVFVPADLAVGKGVSIEFEPGTTGNQVRKLSTTTATFSPGTTTETFTQVTRPEDMGTATLVPATVPIVTGTVQSYVPGESVTIRDSKGSRFTYVLARDGGVPKYVIRGKRVTVFVAKDQPGATYVLEREGDDIKIRAKAKD